MTACTLGTESGSTSTTTPSSANPYGTLVGADPENPYPLAVRVENQLWITVNYYQKDVAQEKVARNEKYFGIGRGFISDSKTAEGLAECSTIRFKKLNQTNCQGKYPYSKLQIADKSTVYTDTFDGEPYVLEENFRGEKLDLDDDGVFDVVFVVNETQTAKSAEGGKIFDIFLAESKQGILDTPDVSRGTLTGKNTDGETVTLGRTLREIFEDCGQPAQTQIQPSSLGLVGIGLTGRGVDQAGEIEELNKKYAQQETLPRQLNLAPLESKKDEIDKINSGKGDLVKEFLDSGIAKMAWWLAGSLSNGDEHAGNELFAEKNALNLDNLIETFSGKVDSSSKIKAILTYNKNARLSYLTITLEDKNGQKQFLRYRPQTFKGTTITVENANGSGSNLQAQQFSVSQEEVKIDRDPWCGFTPESKPAIYLYPKTTQMVRVKIGPAVGQRTITIPPYDPEEGWQVLATPQGEIFAGGQKYSHLFYEAMTPYPAKPPKGWVIRGAGENLETDLAEIGRWSGLNETEARELTRYWANKLPAANYYFVGLINREEIDRLEPLEISPTPDRLLRLRYYFSALKDKTTVESPELTPFVRSGFTAVEWGGYVGE